MNIKRNLWLWVVIGVIVLIGIIILSNNPKQQENLTNQNQGNAAWVNVELKDVRTGEIFKISDFEGNKVLIESFAVWCPTCTKQQKEIKKLHDEVGDSIVSISLDTDPNEDESKILAHVNENGFEWRYAVSPIEMTQSLLSEFGNSIINAPSAPIVLICEDGNYRKLRGSGSKSVEELKEELKRGC
ncbi:redoxin family protein [Candidatus Pacearchaeota archaeon]|nr:redoxin family protein [Candidatus Pacearchaeota archaeon]